jgi:hypothetical protein
MKAEAVLYKTDGTTEEVEAKNGKDFSLEELQKYVGGYIEVVNLNTKLIMIVNEEGKLNNLPLNERATTMFINFQHKVNDVIVGNALVMNSKFMK